MDHVRPSRPRVTFSMLMLRLSQCAAEFGLASETTKITAQHLDQTLIVLRNICQGRSFVFPREQLAHLASLTEFMADEMGKQDALARMPS